ncbi:metal-dependent hydrolase [Halovivax gelatinilyticus]|uniref:metal-dependent hydrolase n=1 Tax=Halovivax gelatinilyticus TaxID=2961597 RepID=UPI0020CA5D16|nr:metal-dependent hydrolase [Halovivax gelatinilyticus]
MQPVVHLAVGYLCWATYTRYERGEPPESAPTAAVLVGAAIPDLVDKPLYAAGAVDVGRTIGHSLLFVVPLVVAVWVLARSVGRSELGLAFAVGVLSHVATDVPWHVVSGDFDELRFLLWPVTPMPPYTGVKPLGTVGGVEVTTLSLEAVVLVAGLVVWWSDGRPGIDLPRRG